MEFIKNINYIVISELPQEQQEPFNNWLFGQTRPLVEQEGENARNCAYKSDYNIWLNHWKKGQEAPMHDI